MPNEYRSSIFLSAGRVRATFLVNGFVCGTWKIENAQGAATLVVFAVLAFLGTTELLRRGYKLRY